MHVTKVTVSTSCRGGGAVLVEVPPIKDEAGNILSSQEQFCQTMSASPKIVTKDPPPPVQKKEKTEKAPAPAKPPQKDKVKPRLQHLLR